MSVGFIVFHRLLIPWATKRPDAGHPEGGPIPRGISPLLTLSPDDLHGLNADLHAVDRITQWGHVMIALTRLSHPSIILVVFMSQGGVLPSPKPVENVTNVVLFMYMTK